MTELHAISNCDRDDRRADVVFLHGLGGDAFGTWRNSNGDLWPQWLGEEFPDVGIWSLDYASSPSKWLRLLKLVGLGSRNAGHSMPLTHRAGQVLDLLRMKGVGTRPVFFICHSLGGLLFKQVLRRAHDINEPSAQGFNDSVFAVLFLATPHAGSELATLCTSLRTIFQATASMTDLQEHASHLEDLNEWFRSNADTNLRVDTYFETQPVAGLLVVNHTSAHCGVGRRPIALDEDHLSIAKPRSRDAQVHLAAREILSTTVLDPYRSRGSGSARAAARAAAENSTTPKPPPMELPPRAERFVGRLAEVTKVADRIRDRRNTAIVGPAGIGKTAIAGESVRQVVGVSMASMSTSPYPGGVLFLDMYKLRADRQAFFTSLADKVAGGHFMYGAIARMRAVEACRGREMLVVVEGAEEADGAAGRPSMQELLEVLAPENRWLLLTRLQTQASPLESIAVREPLDEVEAKELLDVLVDAPLEEGLSQRTLALARGHPLAITWASALLRAEDQDAAKLVQEWESDILQLADPVREHHTLDWLFRRSAAGLNETEAGILAVAGLMAHAPLPLLAFSDDPVGEDSVRGALKGLVNKGLLRAAGPNSWRFIHVLAYQFARSQAPNVAAFERSENWLIKAFRELPRHGADVVEIRRLLEHANAMLRADHGGTQVRWFCSTLLSEARSYVAEGMPALAKLALSELPHWMERSPDTWTPWISEIYLMLARIELSQGRSAEALAAANHGRELALKLIADPSLGSRFQTEQERTICLIQSQVTIADVLSDSHRRDEARSVFHEALELWLQIDQCDLGRAELMRKLTWELRLSGDLESALAMEQRALAEVERVLEEYPGHMTAPSVKFHCRMQIADLLARMGRTDEALAILRECLVEARSFAEQRGENSDWPANIGTALRNTGDAMRRQGQLDMALAYQNDACEIIENLYDSQPASPFLRDMLGACYREIAELLKDLGQFDSALKVMNQSIRLARDKVAADPTNTSGQRHLANGLELLGDIHREMGTYDLALAAFEESLDLTKHHFGPATGTSFWSQWVADLLDRIGHTHLESKAHGPADSAFREAVEIADRCRQAMAGGNWDYHWCKYQGGLGDALVAAGKLESALETYRAAVSVADAGLTRDPSDEDWIWRRGYILEHLATACLESDPNAALSYFQQSLECSSDLARRQPDNLVYQRDVGVDYHNVGEALMALEDYGSAIGTLEKARDVRSRLASTGLQARYVGDLQRTLELLAVAYAKSGRTTEATAISGGNDAAA